MFTLLSIVIIIYALKNLFTDSAYAVRGQAPQRWTRSRFRNGQRSPIWAAIGRYVAAVFDDAAKDRTARRAAKRAKKAAVSGPDRDRTGDEVSRRRQRRQTTRTNQTDPEPASPTGPDQTSGTSNDRKDTPVTDSTAPVGDVAGFESTVALLDAMDNRLVRIDDALGAIDSESQALSPEADQLHAFLSAKNVDGNTMQGVSDLVDSIDLEAIAALMQKVEMAKAAVAAARASLLATYGDAADTVASTGVDPTLLASA